MMPELPRELLATIIGFASGALASLSALPRIISLLRNPVERLHEAVPRNAALALGNFGWILYSVLTHALPLFATALVACTLNFTVLCLVVHARLTERRRRTAPLVAHRRRSAPVAVRRRGYSCTTLRYAHACSAHYRRRGRCRGDFRCRRRTAPARPSRKGRLS